jgi:MoxR-like ATPase
MEYLMAVLEEVEALANKISESIIGQESVVQRILLCLLSNGNLLLEGLPGLAKTRAIKALATNLQTEFNRVQFTPDLLPSDITGTELYLGEDSTDRFQFQPGPIFANIVLADEINRAPAKVQAALLEAMEERQVTVAGTTHKLPDLFMVMATQNPIEQEGTYPLPEAQMDRFFMHVMMEYPSPEDEVKVLRLVRNEEQSKKTASIPTTDAQLIFDARNEIQKVEISQVVERYIVDIVNATRNPSLYNGDLARWITVGASPRGGIALDKASRAFAWLNKRHQVLPDDVRAVAHDCLRHRIGLSYEAHADGMTPDEILSRLLTLVAVP